MRKSPERLTAFRASSLAAFLEVVLDPGLQHETAPGAAVDPDVERTIEPDVPEEDRLLEDRLRGEPLVVDEALFRHPGGC